uniref:Fe2OG dioxygenase domain-containing protein n=1 Tax=Florenciella parvula TaxID=236787 RepID=A0A7S2CTK7_9STRA
MAHYLATYSAWVLLALAPSAALAYSYTLPPAALQQLHTDGLCVVPRYIEPQLCEDLIEDMKMLREAGAFISSGVGSNDKRRQEGSIRTSHQCPLFPPPKPHLGNVAARRELYGLVDDLGYQLDSTARPLHRPLNLELGYLHYPEGGHYGRHFDVPAHEVVDGRGRSVTQERRVSFLLYLNTGWSGKGYGGELRVHEPLDAAESAQRKALGHRGFNVEISSDPVRPIRADVEPEGGTLVCFYSDSVEHEVLVTHRERQCVVGWLRGPAPPVDLSAG